MIRMEQHVFLLILRMKKEMEMSEQVKESYLMIDHIRLKMNPYPKLYWMETVLYNQPRIEFDIHIWNPCSHCTHCESIQSMLQGGTHMYFTIKEFDQQIILQKKQNQYENRIKKKTGWLSS